MTKFTIYGYPHGKVIPNTIRLGNVCRETAKSREYGELIARLYKQSKGRNYGGKKVYMSITVYVGIPKNVPDAARFKMLSGEIFPERKPDIDEIATQFLDSLVGVAYDNKNQVCSLSVQKFYTVERTRVEVEVDKLY